MGLWNQVLLNWERCFKLGEEIYIQGLVQRTFKTFKGPLLWQGRCRREQKRTSSLIRGHRFAIQPNRHFLYKKRRKNCVSGHTCCTASIIPDKRDNLKRFNFDGLPALPIGRILLVSFEVNHPCETFVAFGAWKGFHAVDFQKVALQNVRLSVLLVTKLASIRSSQASASANFSVQFFKKCVPR